MPKQIIPWKEFEIKNFKGIAASTVTPEINACTECENLDPRNDLVSLRTRLGYTLKYAAPTNARMTGTTYLGSENFFIPNIDSDVTLAKEVTCYVNRGALVGTGVSFAISMVTNDNPCVVTAPGHTFDDGDLVNLIGIGDTDPLYYYVHKIAGGSSFYISTDPADLAGSHFNSTSSNFSTNGIASSKPDNINMLNIWIRSYFNGTAWVNAWQWLNEAYLIKLHSEDTEGYIKYLNTDDTTLTTIAGWSIYNITKGDVALVVKCALDVTLNKMKIKMSNSSYVWSIGDDLLIMRHYVPYNELVAMGTSAVAKDITFHKVLNDLRIGFGGKVGMQGLAVGHRKYYQRLREFAFGTGDGDLSIYAHNINRIILTPYNINPYSAYKVGIAYMADTDTDYLTTYNKLPAADYHFKVVALLDNSSQFLVAEGKVTLPYDSVIRVWAKAQWGAYNLRTTGFDIYFSNDGLNYFWLKTIPLIDYTDAGNYDYLIGEDGFLSYADARELATDENATIANDTDYNTLTGWTGWTDPLNLITYAELTVKSTTPQRGTYCIRYAPKVSSSSALGLYMQYTIPNLVADTEYLITFYVRSHNEATTPVTPREVYAQIGILSQAIMITPADDTWTKVSLILRTSPQYDPLDPASAVERCLVIYKYFVMYPNYFEIDNLSVKENYTAYDYNSDTPSKEYIQDVMGYTPTYDLVKSWDNALVTGGRVLVIHPYLDKRYENYIFGSVISDIFMWDVIAGDEYFQMENYDGNNIEAITMLPNLDFLLLRKNSTERRDSQVGTTREILFGNGIIAKKSAINFGDKVIWCSRDDVVMSNGNQVNLISDGTIRGTYRDITDKTVIAAIREDKESSYRMTTGTKEYVFTKVGWITEKRGNPPIHYLSSVENKLIYAGLNGASTDIFEEIAEASDYNGDSIAFKWRSIPIDINLLGEVITGNQRLYLRSIWLNYNAYKADCSVKVYLDNSTKSFPVTGIPFTMGALPNYQTKKLPVGAFCRRFELEVAGNDYSGMGFEILSIGFMFKLIGIGKHDGR